MLNHCPGALCDVESRRSSYSISEEFGQRVKVFLAILLKQIAE